MVERGLGVAAPRNGVADALRGCSGRSSSLARHDPAAIVAVERLGPANSLFLYLVGTPRSDPGVISRALPPRRRLS